MVTIVGAESQTPSSEYRAHEGGEPVELCSTEQFVYDRMSLK